MRRIRVILFLLPLLASAGAPAWWFLGDTPVITPGALQNNEGPVVSGQLKHVANEAKKYLDSKLADRGGAGAGIVAFANNNPSTNDSIVTVGQLKAVAMPFYDRLIEAGYPTREILRWNGYPSTWTSIYPWPQDVTATAENAAPCTIGQLKLAFAFDLTDSDSDGLPDFWEQLHGTDVYFAGDAFFDSDGDGYVALSEFELGTDPNDYFNGVPPAGPPIAPSGVVATLKPDGRLLVRWNDNSTNESSFRIFSIRPPAVSRCKSRRCFRTPRPWL